MRTFKYAVVAVLAIGALTLVGCGSDEPKQTDAESSPSPQSVDLAFANDMIAHHQGAVEMAKAAQANTGRPEIRKLADQIIDAQEPEIATMTNIQNQLESEGVSPAKSPMTHSEMGMDFDVMQMKDSGDFDKAFIDAMIPHHRGAIAMAEVQLEDGENPQLRKLAENVIESQQAEIDQMQVWRKQWFGANLPDSPGPSAEQGMDDEQMDHSGH